MNHTHVDRYAGILWDYMKMNHGMERADCIIGLGSHDKRVAQRAAELFLQGYAPLIVFTGGWGRLTSGVWDEAEAVVFSRIAVQMGVPGDKILIEAKATNTGENVRFSKKLLLGEGIKADRVIAVQKPYMERRTYATFRKQWEEVDVMVTSPQLSYEEYCYKSLPEGITRDEIIHIMVGDAERIKMYPQKGYQIEQEIPPEVWDAFERLIALGYTKHLTK